ncbi:hypothetical protein AX16_002598 [Volvariella volvacea WC 439]|nr:hypothetical protein AX16_002598 [Volvariella volvacea WC 439]
MPLAQTQAYKDAEAERRAIDDEVLRLLSRRNELAPISCLPPEVIADLIAFYLDLHPTTERRHLVIVSQISRHIRDVVIGHPPLWTNIDLSASREWNELCLLRSKASSLRIYGHITNSYMDSARMHIKLLKGHEWRFKAIDLSMAIYSDSEGIRFEGSAPGLEKLVLRCNSNYVPFDLLTCMFPHPIKTLRHMELEKCAFSWTDESLTSDNLTHLSIHVPPEPLRAQLKGILTALSAMPNLQFLSLQETLISATTDEMSTPLPDAHLPHLTQITIMDDNPSNISALISHIHPHARTQYDFVCQRTTSSNVGPFLDLITSIALRIATTSDRHIHKLTLLSDINSSLISLQCADDSEESLTATLKRHFAASEYGSIVDSKKLLEIAVALPVDHVEEFGVEIDHGDTSALLGVLNRMQHLKTLNVHGDFESFMVAMKSALPNCAGSVFKQAQAKDKGRKAGENKRNVRGRGGRSQGRGRGKDRRAKPSNQGPHSCNKCALFVYSPWANLQKLGFVHGRFEFDGVLLQFLVFRQQIGRQLAVLEFNRCRDIYEDELDDYRCLVGSVDWDGVLEMSSDDDDEDMYGWNDEVPSEYEDYSDYEELRFGLAKWDWY